MLTSAIDLLLRGRQATIPELVELLRNIHCGGKRPQRPTPLAPPDRLADSRYDAISLIQRLLLDSLTRSNRDLSPLLAPNAKESSPDQAARLYSAMRDGIERLERDLNHHAAAVESILNRGHPAQSQLASGLAYQETLYLQCSQGGRTAGRFRCFNRSGQRVSVASSVRQFTIRGISELSTPIVTVQPDSFVVDADASAIVSVNVDLDACPTLVNEDLRGCVELHMNGEIALKIWLEMHVYEQL